MSVINGVVGVGGGAIGAEYYRSGDDQFVGPSLTGSIGIAFKTSHDWSDYKDPTLEAFFTGTHEGKLGSSETNWSGVVGGKIGYRRGDVDGSLFGNLLGGVRFNSSPLLESRTPQVGVEVGYSGTFVPYSLFVVPGLRLMVLTNPADFSDIVIAGGLGGGW